MSSFAPLVYEEAVSPISVNDPSKRWKSCSFRAARDTNCKGPLLTDEVLFYNVVGKHGSSKVILRAVHRTGDLCSWLSQQADMEIQPLWKRALFLTSLFKKLEVPTGHESEMAKDVVSRILVCDDPIQELKSISGMKFAVLEYATVEWEMLQKLPAIPSRKMEIRTLVRDMCLRKYRALKSNFLSKVCTQSKRYSAPLLARKIRKQCSEKQNRLEAKLREDERSFLESQKAELSRQAGSGPSALRIKSCQLRKSRGYGLGSFMRSFVSPNPNQDYTVAITYTLDKLENERKTWTGLELAPMKEDLDRLSTSSEHTFQPCCSESKELLDLDPNSHVLSRVFFLKSGQLLLFVIGVLDHSQELLIYLCPKLGFKVSAKNIIQRLKRGFDLISFDERSRFIAFYDSTICVIKTFRFDEAFRHMDWVGVDIHLGEYSIGRVVWMDFVPGKHEIVFIDDLNRARLCEVNQPGLVRSGNLHIGEGPVVKACVSSEGSSLLLVRNVKSMGPVTEVRDGKLKDQEEFASKSDSATQEETLVIEFYKLGDVVRHFQTIPLDLKVKDWSTLVIDLVTFASQMHLVIFNSDSPSTLISKLIKISLASEVCQLQQVTQPQEFEVIQTSQDAKSKEGGPVLDYIYQVFEKYAISPPLGGHPRGVNLCMILRGKDESNSSPSLSDRCIEYVNNSLNSLKRDKGKDFSALDLELSVHDASRFQSYKDLPWSSDEGFWVHCKTQDANGRLDDEACLPCANSNCKGRAQCFNTTG